MIYNCLIFTKGKKKLFPFYITFLKMFDDPPPRPFHTFKFPHIAVEVETTPQVTAPHLSNISHNNISLYLLKYMIVFLTKT